MSVYEQYYRFKGSSTSTEESQKIGEHLEKLTQINGGELKPQNVVDDAKIPKSPIHKYFDWNDTTAAKKYRLTQARKLVNSIEIVHVRREIKPKQYEIKSVKRIDPNDQDISAQAFLNVADDEKQSYRPIKKVFDNAELRQIALKKARDDFSAWLKRFERIEAFGELIESIVEDNPVFAERVSDALNRHRSKLKGSDCAGVSARL